MEEENASEGEKKARLIMELKEKPWACDLMWSLFRAAAESYKFDSLLRPFPKMFLDQHGEKQIEKLRDVAASIPGIIEMTKRLQEGTANDDQIALLHFVLIQSKPVRLRAVKREDVRYPFYKILERVQSRASLPALPQHIFELDHTIRGSAAKFQSLATKYGLRYGFHGSRVENFYSIIQSGLQVSLNKVAAFGPGVYVSGDLCLSFTYSPTGITWRGSILGEKISIIALCEMIDHEDVKCQDDRSHSRKYAEEDRSVQVPPKYYVVQNSDLIRVTHLLVYSFPGLKRNEAFLSRITRKHVVKSIFLLILVYCVLNIFNP